MGLDMYLDRYPRYKNWTATQLNVFDNYKSYLKRKDKKMSFERWCGNPGVRPPSKEDMEALEKLSGTRYWSWDTEHKYPHESLSENVMYWRKANMIHKWFVDRVQDGEDDCGIHNEVTKEILEELLEKCKFILENVVMITGKVKAGERLTPKGWEGIYEDGYQVLNPEICRTLLPTADGFFFGNTEYDGYYIEQVKETYEGISKVLSTTDFDKQMIYYVSSW